MVLRQLLTSRGGMKVTVDIDNAMTETVMVNELKFVIDVNDPDKAVLEEDRRDFQRLRLAAQVLLEYYTA